MTLNIDMTAFQEDRRKIGVAIVIAGMVALILEESIRIVSALMVNVLGWLVWVTGLVRRPAEEKSDE
ncbi:MAG: hypothetical protein JXR29_04490 [Methylothermaceae bacterium]|nr:hypothetical protein [Methylothermaceae bacterium]